MTLSLARPRKASALQNGVDHVGERVGVKRLAHRVGGADRGRDREVVLLLDPAAARDRDDLLLGQALLDLDDRLDALLVGHDDVADHQIEARVVDRGEPGGAGLGFADVVALVLEHRADRVADLGFVVDHQNVGHGLPFRTAAGLRGHSSSASGSRSIRASSENARVERSRPRRAAWAAAAGSRARMVARMARNSSIATARSSGAIVSWSAGPSATSARAWAISPASAAIRSLWVAAAKACQN